MLYFCPQGGVIALEVCLAGHCEGCTPCKAALWLRMAAPGSQCWVLVGVTPARLHEGIGRVFVAVVPTGRQYPVGCAFWHVGCVCPGFELRAGSRWAPWWCLPGCSVPRLICVVAMCRGRGWGGARVTRGLRLVGGRGRGGGGMLGVRHRYPRSRTRLASVRYLVASACRHVRRAIRWRTDTLLFWLARPAARYLRSGWSLGG